MLRVKDGSTLTDPLSPAGGAELPPRREQGLPAVKPSYVSSSGATVMTSKGLAEPGSATTPPAPRVDLFGDRVSHITDRFVLSGNREAYRIWKFQSAAPPIEFPMTEDGWAQAWTKFRELH
jgi:hypothetical protein